MSSILSAARTAACLGALLVSPVLAGDPYDQGNGVGNAYIATTQAIIGGTFVVDAGTTATTFAPSTILSISDGIGPSNSIIGPICLEVNSPAYFFAAYPLDVNGNFHVEVNVPNIPALVGAPPIFANALTVEVDGGPAFISVSKTVRFQWELPDSHRIVGSMSVPRAMHTATSLGAGPFDNEARVLIAGGGEGNFIFPAPLASTELYHPLTRSFTVGPDMSVPRMTHRSVRLPDGRVLITGGVTTGGVVTATCDIFDPATGTIVPTSDMNAPRSGHALTILPNAKVLASGGFSNWQNPSTQFVADLNTAQRSAELYDPVSGTWTPTATDMVDDRAGHTQTLLPTGEVLIVGGVNGGYSDPIFGGAYPTMTSTCELYDPFLDQYTPTASMGLFGAGGRAFHGASLLPSGNVLITGGVYFADQNTGVAASSATSIWDGATWTFAGALPQGIAFHRQLPSGDGALITGGHTSTFTTLAASTATGVHDGTGYVARAPVGTHAQFPTQGPFALGNHEMTRLFDGTYLLTGGAYDTGSGVGTWDRALVYVP